MTKFVRLTGPYGRLGESRYVVALVESNGHQERVLKTYDMHYFSAAYMFAWDLACMHGVGGAIVDKSASF